MHTAVQNKNQLVVMPKPHIPQVHHATLGKVAVLHNDEMVYKGDMPNVDSSTGMPLPEMSLHEVLEPVRERFYKLGQVAPETLHVLDRYMENLPAPFISRVKKERLAGDLSWADWLGGVARDEELLNFLQWHVHSLENQQKSPAIRTEIARQRELYQDGLARGAQQGWLHSRGARRASQRIRKVRTYLGDVFDTLMEERGGYHRRNTTAIVISNFIKSPYSTLEDAQLASLEFTYTHEANHAALGTLGDTWLDEALTEHIAQVIKYGDPYNLYPSARTEGEGGYPERRRLLHTFLHGPNNPSKRGLGLKAKIKDITQKDAARSARALQLAMLAYSAPPGAEKWALTQQFVDITNEIWDIPRGSNMSALAMLSSQVSMLEEKYVSKGISSMKAQAQAAEEVEAMLLSKPKAVFDLSKHEHYNTLAA